jgi:hypothetical protein
MREIELCFVYVREDGSGILLWTIYQDFHKDTITRPVGLVALNKKPSH